MPIIKTWALTENMLEKLALDILGTTDVPYQGEVFSFKGPFKKISMFDAILERITPVHPRKRR